MKLSVMKVLVVSLLFVLGLTGCVGNVTKVQSQIDYPKFSQQDAPLSSNLSEEDEYQFALDLASFQVKYQKYEQAENLLQRLRKVKSEDIEVYRLLAKSYEGLRQQDTALIAWQQVVKLRDSTIDDESEYARVAIMLSKYELAEAIYKEWINSGIKSTRVSGLNNLGFSALLQKDLQLAEGYFERALKEDPLNSKAMNNLKLIKEFEEK